MQLVYCGKLAVVTINVIVDLCHNTLDVFGIWHVGYNNTGISSVLAPVGRKK